MMSEPHPDVTAAVDIAAAIDSAEPARRVELLEALADRLESALADHTG